MFLDNFFGSVVTYQLLWENRFGRVKDKSRTRNSSQEIQSETIEAILEKKLEDR